MRTVERISGMRKFQGKNTSVIWSLAQPSPEVGGEKIYSVSFSYLPNNNKRIRKTHRQLALSFRMISTRHWSPFLFQFGHHLLLWSLMCQQSIGKTAKSKFGNVERKRNSSPFLQFRAVSNYNSRTIDVLLLILKNDVIISWEEIMRVE